MKQQMIDTYRELQRIRAVHEDTFPTPNTKHSWMFVMTEVGEAIDAELRSYPVYKRNNDKEHDLRAELADVTLMLYTSIHDEDNLALTTIDEYLENSPFITRQEHLMKLAYLCGLGCSYASMDRYSFADLAAVDALTLIYHIDNECGQRAIDKLIATQEKFVK